MISVSIGYPQTLSQGVTYALPSRVVFIKSNQILQTSLDGTNWNIQFNSISTGFQTSDSFLRCTFSNAVVELKKGVKNYIESGLILSTSNLLWLIASPNYLFTNTAGTIPVVNNGDLISVWKDSLGNGYQFNNNVINPTYNPTGLNGNPTVKFGLVATSRFDGNTTTLSLLQNSPGNSVIAAVNNSRADEGSAFSFFRWSKGTATTQRVAYFINNGAFNSGMAQARLDADVPVNQVAMYGYVSGTPSVTSAITEYATTSFRGYKNGILKNTSDTFLSSGLSSNTPALAVTLGNVPGNSNELYDISEFIITPNIFSTEIRQAIENYLIAKYSIV